MSAATASASPAPPQALPRRKVVFVLVALTLIMGSADQTIVATALHAIETDLGAGLEWSAWTITVYGLGQVLISPVAGALGERFGYKRTFMTALAIFTAASLACALAPDIVWLVVFRAVQSLGGGSILPVAVAIVAQHFGPNRDRATALFTSVFPIGGALGPFIGGFFATPGTWRLVFVVNLPVGVLVLIGMAVLLKRQPASGTQVRADALGIGLLTGGVLALMLAITSIGSVTTGLDWRIIAPAVLAVVLLGLFLRRMAVSPAPFIPLRFVAGRGFGALNVINAIAGASGVGFAAAIPLYGQAVYGMDPLASGLLLTWRSVGMIGIAAAATFLLRRTGYRVPMVIGPILGATGFIGTALVPGSIDVFFWLSAIGAVSGIGQGVYLPASNTATLQLAPDSIGAVSGVRGMFRTIGTIVAVSVSTAVLARLDSTPQAFVGVFLTAAAVQLLVIPMAFLIPEHRGRW